MKPLSMAAFNFLWARLPRGERAKTVVEHAFVFAGDLLPYGLIFFMTVLLGFRFGLEAAGAFSLSYAYVAIVTTLVAGPNLLSIRRRMPTTEAPGAVVAASLILRVTLIFFGAVAALTLASLAGMAPAMVWIIGLLLIGRLLETCIDAPATSIQYLKPAKLYFLFRLGQFILLMTIVGLGFASIDPNLQREAVPIIAFCYIMGTGLVLSIGLALAWRLFSPLQSIWEIFAHELRGQVLEFGRFFVASAFFVAASRVHPVIVTGLAGVVAAERFATIFNLFAALSLIATGISGMYFWSRNRTERDHRKDGIPIFWLLWAIPGGLLLGGLGGLAIQELFLRHVNAPDEMRIGAWILCLATPFLITQSIVSNTLVLQKRDREMLTLSIINASVSIVIIAVCVSLAGLIGASFAVGLSAFFSTLIGVFVVSRAR